METWSSWLKNVYITFVDINKGFLKIKANLLFSRKKIDFQFKNSSIWLNQHSTTSLYVKFFLEVVDGKTF